MTCPSKDSLATYGGRKQDYDPAESAATDRAADEGEQAFASTAMMTRMCPQAEVEFTGIATGFATVTYHEAMWGNSNEVKPTVERQALGHFHIVFPVSVDDELDVSHDLNLQRGRGHVTSGTTAFALIVTRAAPNEFDVYVRDMAGAATDGVGTSFLIEVR